MSQEKLVPRKNGVISGYQEKNNVRSYNRGSDPYLQLVIHNFPEKTLVLPLSPHSSTEIV